jgi:hypothetical protein
MILILEIFEFFYALITKLFDRKTDPNLDLRNRDVLILPGFGAGRGFYRKLEKKLAQAGYRPFTLPLPSFRNESIQIPILKAYLAKASSDSILIAHNSAGLLIGGLPDSARRKIDTLITLGTPFQGFRFLGFWQTQGWEHGSSPLEMRMPTYLFINRFHPLAPIRDYFFQPKDCNVYGQGRDQWFDIAGTYNLVRRGENLRTLVDYLQSVHAPKFPQPIPDARTQSPEQKLTRDPGFNEKSGLGSGSRSHSETTTKTGSSRKSGPKKKGMSGKSSSSKVSKPLAKKKSTASNKSNPVSKSQSGSKSTSKSKSVKRGNSMPKKKAPGKKRR